ncbi:profilin, required for normal timing of actin polymerization in response to thermal stress [Coemansia sp. RSA 988]|nr:profilin, required for normal timing of actin polymerization in response to thermal stress [Coemansia sp. RSA 988]
MSWKGYIERFMSVPGVTSAAIVGKNVDALSVWAQSENFTADNARLLTLVKNLPSFDALHANGITLVEGCKYFTTVATPAFIHGRKDNHGVLIFDFYIGYAILVYAPGADVGKVTNGADKVVEYLRKVYIKDKPATG